MVGTGAMGILLAVRLAAAGYPVTLVDHRPARAAQIHQQGLSVIERDGRRVTSRIPCLTEPGEGALVRWLFLCVKNDDTERALARSLPFLSPDGCVVSLQNGVQHVDVIRQHVDAGNLVVGTTAQGATLTDVGSVRHAGVGDTQLAQTRENAAAAQHCARLLTQAGWPARTVEDMTALLWRKLLINAAINPVTALLNMNNGTLAATPAAWRAAMACFREAKAVADRCFGKDRIQITEADVLDVCLSTAENTSSMCQDIRRGKRTEIRCLNGYVAAQGERVHCPTPANDIMVTLVTALEEAHR